MITKNFKMLLAMILGSNGATSSKGLVEVKDFDGNTKYMGYTLNGFPGTVTRNVYVTGATVSGIMIGSGNTAPTENDYRLEQRITSGLTPSTPTVDFYVDANGNPYEEIMFTLTNTTGDDIVVKEIGYVQTLKISSTTGGAATTNGNFLLDRTVLETPVTVPANDSAAIKYRLKTELSS